jgi:hypothetical protein
MTRTTCLLPALLLLASTLPARADGCSDQTAAMRAANLRYRTSASELALLQRDLGPVGQRSEEQVLRSVRRYGLAIRDLRDMRAHIVALYRALVAADCAPFDQQGLDQTITDFRTYTAQEERVFDEARRLAGTNLVTN